MDADAADPDNLRPSPSDAASAGSGDISLLRARFLAYLEQTFPRREYKRGVWLAISLVGMGAGYIAGTAVTIALAPDHAVQAALLLPLIALLVARAGITLQRLRKTRRYYNRLRGVVETGTPVNTYVVQANEALSAPAKRRCRAWFCSVFSPRSAAMRLICARSPGAFSA